MARGFGSTLGVGTTDVIVTAASFATPALRSISIWANRNGEGGGNLGRMFGKTSGGLLFEGLFNDQTAGVYRFLFRWSTGTINCTWDITRPAASEWHHIGVSYDDGSTSNDPVMYLDGVSQSVTESAGPPAGSPGSATAPFDFGNRSSDSLRVWDGSLAEPAYWNVILTPEEFAALGAGVSPLTIRPMSLLEYMPLLGPTNSYITGATTVTGTAVQPHPRTHYPARRRRVYVPSAAAAARPALIGGKLTSSLLLGGLVR